MKYGIVYGLRGAEEFELDGPYESREAAMEAVDPDSLREYGGAAGIVRAREHTAEVGAPFDPGAEVAEVEAE